MRTLAQRGADLDRLSSTDRTSALHMATQRGQRAAVSELLAMGADPNLADGAGQSALYRAVVRGELEITEELLRNGADAVTEGASLLAQTRNEAMINLLKRSGARAVEDQ